MSPRLALGSTEPPIEWIPVAVSPGVQRPGREADHSTPASAEVKEMWIYTSTPGVRSSVVGLRDYATSRKVAGSNPDEVDFSIYLILPAAL
jgi:hypothetical protein